MKKREFANIVFKAMGLYWLVNAILHIIHGVLMPFSDFGSLPNNIWKIELINQILIGTIYGLMSFLLIFRTEYALNLLKLNVYNDEPLTGFEPTIDYKRLAFGILGVYFFVPAISAVLPPIIKLLLLPQASPSRYEKSWTTLLENSIQLVIGAMMIIGRLRLLQLWHRLRPLSSSEEDDSESKE